MTPGQVCSSLGVSLLKRLLAVMFLVVVSGQFCDARPDDQQQTVKLSQTHPKIRLEPTIIQAKLPYSFWSLMGLMHPHGSLFPCFQLIIWEQPLSFSQNQSKCPPPVHLFIYIDNVQIRELLHINITARLKPVDSVAFINKKQNKTKHCTPFFFLQQKRQCMWQATLDIMCSLYWKTLWVNVNCHMWDSSRCCGSEANAQ